MLRIDEFLAQRGHIGISSLLDAYHSNPFPLFSWRKEVRYAQVCTTLVGEGKCVCPRSCAVKFLFSLPGFLIVQTCPDVSVDPLVTGKPSWVERGTRCRTRRSIYGHRRASPGRWLFRIAKNSRPESTLGKYRLPLIFAILSCRVWIYRERKRLMLLARGTRLSMSFGNTNK